MGYCHRCGVFADLDAAAMCGTCRDGWRPAGDRPGDLGYHGQPQPLGVFEDGHAETPASFPQRRELQRFTLRPVVFPGVRQELTGP
jgi:hypothetical protein